MNIRRYRKATLMRLKAQLDSLPKERVTCSHCAVQNMVTTEDATKDYACDPCKANAALGGVTKTDIAELNREHLVKFRDWKPGEPVE